MVSKVLISALLFVTLLIDSPVVSAANVPPGGTCNDPKNDTCVDLANNPTADYACLPSVYDKNQNKVIDQCLPVGVGSAFKSIKPPPSLIKFFAGDPSGATGISKFLSNLITLIYIFAAIALLAMLLWGAFDWIISEGDKEKVASARNKIINAIIGLMLFALAFAILRVLGTFTGFKFFAHQDVKMQRNYKGEVEQIVCEDGFTIGGPNAVLSPPDPSIWCKGHGY